MKGVQEKIGLNRAKTIAVLVLALMVLSVVATLGILYLMLFFFGGQAG